MAVERRTIWLGAGLVVAIAALLVARSMDNSPLPVPGRRTTPPARSTLAARRTTARPRARPR